MSVTINGTTGIAGVDGSASTPAYQGADTNTGIAFPAADTVSVATGGTERMRITSDGYLRMASGTGGIQFGGDTAAANALDDYEEGTWTPTITGSGSNPTVTYNNQNGYYTKIGRQVFVSGYIAVNTISGGSGAVNIGGLPFTVGNQTQNYPAGTIGQMSNFTTYSGNTDGQVIIIRPNASNINMNIYESSELSGGDWQVNQILASFSARFAASYFVD